MRVINLKEGMGLFYINNENHVKECTYLYTNKNGKKYVSFINKKGYVAHTFLPKGTLFFDNENEAILAIKEVIAEKIEREIERKKELELAHKQYLIDKKELSNRIIKRIEESENINQLPLYEDLLELVNEDEEGLLSETLSDTDIFNRNLIMKIKDGTKVIFEHNENICFDDEDHWDLYYISEDDIYICMDCGLWQKSYDEVKKEVGYDDDGFGIKLLPLGWKIEGVRGYLRKGAEYQQKKRLEEDEFNEKYSSYINDEEMCEDYQELGVF